MEYVFNPLYQYHKKPSVSTPVRRVIFGPKVGQIGPKWDNKFGTLSDHISDEILKFDRKSSGFVTFGAKS